MKRNIFHFLKITCFYVIFFALWRAAFLYLNIKAEENFSWSAAFPAFVHGLRMDLSMVGYTLILPLFLFLIYTFFPKRIFNRINYWYHVVIIIAWTHITLANILLYHYWNSLINYRALSYLADPTEVFSSLSAGQSIGLLVLMIILLLIFIFIFRKFFYSEYESVPGKKASSAVVWLSFVALTVTSMRGGWQMLPMNESLVYYSNSNFLNLSAVNPVWHLMYDVQTAGLSSRNPFQTEDQDLVKSWIHSAFEVKADTFPQIIGSERPNIVVLMLESYTADVVASLGGDKRTDPFLETVIQDGILFDSIYSSGTRTDQGIVSVINGWPATPYHSIMRSNEKSARLPSLVKVFGSRGYTTSFYYGGDKNFSNLNAYNVSQNYNRIVSKEDFPDASMSGRWGVHDQFVLSKQLRDLNKEQQPFFSAVMTLSNHEPFDVPGKTRIQGNTDADKFRNTSAYTDASLQTYFEEARKQPWYANTLFIIVADHGHYLPEGRIIMQPYSRHIPLIFYGEVIRKEFRGTRIHKAGGHHDIPATLLKQLGINPTTFSWSKNLLNSYTASFAAWQFEETAAWMEGSKWVVYSYNIRKVVTHSFPLNLNEQDTLVMKAKRYMQGLYGQYQAY